MVTSRPRVRFSIAAAGVLAFGIAGLVRAQEEEPPRPRRWHVFGDANLRGDFVQNLPGAREDLDRARLRLRAGVRRTLGPAWELAAAARASVGTDDNEDNRINLDNEVTNDVGLDRLFARWYGGRAGEIRVGKDELEPSIGPMLWDGDLRPIGLSYAGSWPVRGLDTLGIHAGWLVPDHPLELGSDSRMALAQADWRIRDGASTGAAVTVSYARFYDLDDLPSSGLARTNRVENGRYASEFELVDLQLVARTGSGRWPLLVVLDSVLNLGASRADEDWGGQAQLTLGNRREARGFELALVFERIQRDAVLAAFNSDDWWFRSATRGARAWVAYGVRDDFWLRLSGLSERRDDLDDRLHRVLFDVTYGF